MRFLERIFDLNKVVTVIITGEFILTASFGFLVPIFSIFVVEEVTAGTAQVAGFAIAIYWIVKSVLQLPIARWLDKNHGEIDDFWALIFGNVGSAVIAILFFLYATEIWHIYLFQILWGIADAVLVPPFYAIFTRHLDRGHEGFEWALRSSFSLGAGSALGGALGGTLAGIFGLRLVFLFAGIGALFGTAALLFLKPYIKPKAAPPPHHIFLVAPRRHH